jgi:hypothetical protein
LFSAASGNNSWNSYWCQRGGDWNQNDIELEVSNRTRCWASVNPTSHTQYIGGRGVR